MAKIQITESELKQIVRESVETVINEGPSFQNYYQNLQQGFNPANTSISGHGPYVTHGQVDATNNALTTWNKLGTVGQVKEIQRLAGVPENECDGRIGPQTLAKVYIALRRGNTSVSTGATINADDLNRASFRPGKVGTYNPTAK